MGMPTWWDERRFGIYVNASLATVPAWSPIGEYADWYLSHMGEDVGDVGPHPRPMVEVLAHHRDRWGHIERYDDFLALLSFDGFEAEAWARLVALAGARYTVFAAKHHDGWAWWDAPGSERTVLHGGPRRNVLAEYAAACERNDIVFGVSYSLFDWGGRRVPDPDVTDEVLAQLVDLVGRYGPNLLRGDGRGCHEDATRRTEELLEQIWSIDPTIVVDDRWPVNTGAFVPGDRPDLVHTFEYEMPERIIDTPWELRRGIGGGFGHNRTERAEHHLSGCGIVALLTEVVAKGGHLLLGLGPAADGTIPDLQRAPLEEAGAWIRSHQHLIDASTPWETWGDDDVRYLDVGGELHAVDVGGRGRFPALTDTRWRVESVERSGEPVPYRQDADGLHLDLGRTSLDRRASAGRAEDIAVYRLALAEVDRPVELFEPAPRQPIDLAPLLRNASPGDIVQLGDGRYLGPVTVPAGVILRGLGSVRTTIEGSGIEGSGIEGNGSPAVTLERNARLEHLRVIGDRGRAGSGPTAAVEAAGPYATVLGCRVDGLIVVRSDGSIVRATRACGVVADGAERLSVSRCQFRGTGWDVGIHLLGGSGHEIDSCEFRHHLCAMRVTDTTGTIVRGNNVSARWWGIHLDQTEGAHVYGNFIDHTMRGIDIDGGTQAVIDGNAVCDGDSGCIVEWGASDCQVSGNRWERCRIGVLAWEAVGLHAHDNTATDLHEADAALVTGP